MTPTSCRLSSPATRPLSSAPGPKLLCRRRRAVRALGRPPPQPPYSARLPPRRPEFRRLPRPPLAAGGLQAAARLSRRRAALARRHDGRNQGPQDPQPPHLLAFEFLQVSGRRRRRTAAARQPPQSGARPIHRPGIVRPAGRHAGAHRHPRPSADGSSRRRRRARFPRPRHPQTYLYTGVRLASACRLRVRDFHKTTRRPPSPSTRKATATAPSESIFAAAEALAEIHWEIWTCGRADFPGSPRAPTAMSLATSP